MADGNTLSTDGGLPQGATNAFWDKSRAAPDQGAVMPKACKYCWT